MTFQIGDWVYLKQYSDEWFIKITSLNIGNRNGTGCGININLKNIYVYHHKKGNFGFHRKNPPLWQHASLPLIDENIIIPETGKQYIKELLTYLANKNG